MSGTNIKIIYSGKVPLEQKRCLSTIAGMGLIDLDKKTSEEMGDECVYLLTEKMVLCIDDTNGKIHTLVKNKKGLFIKKQTFQFN